MTYAHKRGLPFLRFINQSGGTIPPHGVFAYRGTDKVDGRGVVYVAKKPAIGHDNYAINGPNSVSDGDTGVGYTKGPLKVRVSGNVEIGRPIGPKHDSYDATPDGGYWWTIESAEAGIVWADGWKELEFRGKAASTIAIDTEGTINVHEATSPTGLPAPTGWTIKGWLDTAHFSQGISSGKGAFARYFLRDLRYVIYGAECEDSTQTLPIAFNPLALSSECQLLLTSKNLATYPIQTNKNVTGWLDTSRFGRDFTVSATNSPPTTRVDSNGYRWLDFIPTRTLIRADALGFVGDVPWTIVLVVDVDDFDATTVAVWPVFSIGDTARAAGKYLEVAVESGTSVGLPLNLEDGGTNIRFGNITANGKYRVFLWREAGWRFDQTACMVNRVLGVGAGVNTTIQAWESDQTVLGARVNDIAGNSYDGGLAWAAMYSGVLSAGERLAYDTYLTQEFSL